MRTILTLLAVVVASSSSSAFADGNDDLALTLRESIVGGGVATAGVGLSARVDGIRDLTATIQLNSVPVGASVHRAYLYWAVWKGADDTVEFDGTMVTGQTIGVSPSTGWQPASPVTSFRADVTNLVAGNGAYTIADLPSSSLNADSNGIGLFVLYQDPGDASVTDVVLHDGALTWCGNARTETFAALGLTDAPITTRFGMIVSDGQTFADPVMAFEGNVLPTTFDGGDGGMWDRVSWDVSALYSVPTDQLAWTLDTSGQDCLHYVAAYLVFEYPAQGGDMGPADMGPVDMGPADMGIGPVDMGPADMGPPDMGIGPADMTAVDTGSDANAVEVGPDFPDAGTADIGTDLADLGRDAAGPDAGRSDMTSTMTDGGSGTDAAALDSGPSPGDTNGTKRNTEGGCCATGKPSTPAPILPLLLLGGVAIRRSRRGRASEVSG